MNIYIKDYCFQEMTHINSHLFYTSRGNVFSVTFNIHNRPHITRIMKTIDAMSIPKDILEQLYWQVWEQYTAGFHTRNHENSSWISARFSELVAGSIFTIDDPLDPAGGITINNRYLDAYIITLSLIDKSIDFMPQECIIASNTNKRKIYLFRYFAELDDLGGYNPSQILKISSRGKLTRTGMDKKHRIASFDDIVAATVYTYNQNSSLILSETAVRNDKYGHDIVSTFGNFIITGGYQYSE